MVVARLAMRARQKLQAIGETDKLWIKTLLALLEG